jgi:hypothetical protein
MAEQTGSPVFHTLWSYVLDPRQIQLVLKRRIDGAVFKQVVADGYDCLLQPAAVAICLMVRRV